MQIKNVTLSATTETEITIEQGYPYVWFKNLGDNTVYVSASPDILDNGSVKTEGVSTITSGECTSVTTKSDKVYAYALGATIVEVHAQGNPESSFKIKAKGGESSVTVEPILITHNGEYTAPEGKAYSPVNVQTPVYNITPLTLTHNHQGAEAGLYGGYSPVQVDIEMDTLNAPSNGVYEIDTTTQDGWDKVIVNVPQQVEIITRTNWNLLSEQQKQAKGLVAIQDSASGFIRGDFVNGADYIQSNKYIPYSDEDKIIGVAYPDLFDASANSWGYGTNPVLYTGSGGKPTLDATESAIYFPANTSDVIGYVDLGAANTPFTAYIVMKAAASSPGRLLSCTNSASNTYLIMFSGAGDNVSIDNWGNGTDLGVSAVSDYFVAAMMYTPQTGWGYVYNPANDNISSAGKTVLACGRYLTIARTDINPSVQYPAPTDVYIKYIAVVNEAETSTAIGNNLRALYNEFVASE